jgi:predicted phosphodiesterase
MRVQILSDVHLELGKRQPSLERHADILVLAGDVGNPFAAPYVQFLSTASALFSKVFVVAGNHEYYGHTMKDTEAKIHSTCQSYRNVVFLQCRAHIHEGVRFVGCTLWSDVQDSLLYKLNDFACILKAGNVRVKPADIRQLHRTHTDFLEHTLNDACSLPTVVVTHHAPMKEMTGSYKNSPLSSGFATDLPHLFRPPVVAWVNGHTHQNLLIKVNEIPCVSNCLGYVDEHAGCSHRAVLCIGDAGVIYEL